MKNTEKQLFIAQQLLLFVFSEIWKSAENVCRSAFL